MFLMEILSEVLLLFRKVRAETDLTIDSFKKSSFVYDKEYFSTSLARFVSNGSVGMLDNNKTPDGSSRSLN